MHGNIFDLVDAAREDLAQHTFVSDAGEPAVVSQQLETANNAHLDQRDYHIAAASKVRHHDPRSYEKKAGVPTRNPDIHPNMQQGQPGNGGGGGGGPGNGSGGGGNYGNQGGNGSGGGKGGGGSGGGGSGGSGSGQKPPPWFEQWWWKFQRRGQGHAGGGGGVKLLGPGALGKLQLMGNVPAGTTASGASTGPSPVVIIALLAIAGLGGYFLWHKLRMARHQDKELDKGEEAKDDAA